MSDGNQYDPKGKRIRNLDEFNKLMRQDDGDPDLAVVKDELGAAAKAKRDTVFKAFKAKLDAQIITFKEQFNGLDHESQRVYFTALAGMTGIIIGARYRDRESMMESLKVHMMYMYEMAETSHAVHTRTPPTTGTM